jgi:hypothetical protein
VKVHPVGQVKPQLLEEDVKDAIRLWKINAPKSTWWNRASGAWISAVGFIIRATDYFIRKIDELIPEGEDKKATVLDALGKVYDVIVPTLMPIWVRPFNKKIKDFIINVVASLLVDFIVSKYHESEWPVEKALEG